MSKDVIVDSGKGWAISKIAPSDASPLLREFLETDFVGGTLVEYLDGAGFHTEWDRAAILSVDRSDGIRFDTDGRAMLWQSAKGLQRPYAPRIERRDGVWYLDIPGMYCYAIAPTGVEIPPPGERKDRP